MYKKILLVLLFFVGTFTIFAQEAEVVQSIGALQQKSACADQNAGVVTLASVSAQSNQIDLESVTFLCYQDQFVVKNMGANLTGDPNLSTPAGIGYAFYSCAPTVSGNTLADIEADPCALNSPPVIGGAYDFWTYTDQIDGTALFRNSNQLGGQTIPEFFNSGNPIQLYFAPITFDNFALNQDEDGGACINVSTDEAFPVVYLNPIQISNFTTGLNGNPLEGSFKITGGLSQYNGTDYVNVYVAKNSNLMNKAQLIGGPYKHGDVVNFIAPEEGNYTILIEDNVSCGFNKEIVLFKDEKNITFDINFTKSTAKVGETVCAQITVKDFVDIQSFEFSLLFNSNVIKFLNFQNFGLPSFDVFNTVSVFSDQGYMTAQWFDSSTNGKTLSDGSVLFEVCFEMIGSPGDCSDFEITGWPTPFEVTCCTNQVPLQMIRNSDEICIEPDVVTAIVANTCGSNNGNQGSLSFYVVGGKAPYNFSIVEASASGILPKEKFEVTLDNLPAGAYTIVVTDADGVIQQKSVTIDNSSPISFELDLINPTCYGFDNGIIKVKNLTGGSPNFKYSWSNNISNVDSIKQVAAGTYFVTVEDNNGCQEIQQAVIGKDPIVANITVVDTATCQEVMDGSVKVIASGGTPNDFFGVLNYNYEFIQPFQKYNNVPEVTHTGIATGKWPVVIKDKNGCSTIDSFSMPFKKEVVIQETLNQGSCGEGPGSILLEASTTNNTGLNFSFNWSANTPATINTPTTSTANNLDEGTYSVIVTDGDGCKATNEYEIDFGSKLLLTGFSEYDCGTGGCIYVFPSGVNTTVEWGDNASDKTIRCNLSPGTYKVTATDLNGCTKDTSFVIEQTSFVVDEFKVTDVSCTGGDGSIQTIISGNPSFQWKDEDGNMYPDNGFISALNAGKYYVTITDPASNCTYEDSVQVNQADLLNIQHTLTKPVCYGDTNGQATLQISGGVAVNGYKIDWPDNKEKDSEIRNDLAAGTYTVTVTDDTSCSNTVTFELENPDSLKIKINVLSELQCFGDQNAIIEAIVSSGSAMDGNYGFKWSDNSEQSLGAINRDTVNTLGAPGGFVIAFDSFCSDTLEFELTQPEEITINSNSVINNVSCYGSCDGSATLTIEGGAGNYQYEWIGTSDTDNSISNLCSGFHKIQLIDDNNCVKLDSVFIQQPDTLVASIVQEGTNNPSCNDASDGVIKITHSGGNQGAVSYNWQNTTATDAEATSLTKGIYYVTITDSKGCQDSISYLLETAPPIQATIPSPAEPICYGDRTCIKVNNVIGGSGENYKFSINSSNLYPIDSCVQVFAGEYKIAIFDSKGCSFDTTFLINQPNELISELGDDITVELGDSSKVIEVQLSTGFVVDTIMWNPNQDFSCLDDDCTRIAIYPSKTTKYTVTAVDKNGCVTTDMIEVRVSDERKIYFPNVFSPNGDGQNDVFKPYAGKGVQEFINFRIFDRWGNQVYMKENFKPTSSNIDGWDGTFKARQMNPGVFTYFVIAQFTDGKIIRYSGDVTLLR